MTATNSGISLTSPNYPNPYGNNHQCLWTISGNANEVIYVVFNAFNVRRAKFILFAYLMTYEFFKVETHSNCVYDALRINEASGQQLGQFCGTTVPAPIVASESSVSITFISDHSVSAPGFSLTIYSGDPNSVLMNRLKESKSSNKICFRSAIYHNYDHNYNDYNIWQVPTTH